MADYPADSVPDAKPSSMLVHDEAKASDGLFDVLVIGAGPTGLACAIEVQKAGFRVVLVDKGCVCNSLFHYPVAHDVFHDAGAAGDREHSVSQPESQADAQ